jgi:hypothetical protein
MFDNGKQVDFWSRPNTPGGGGGGGGDAATGKIVFAQQVQNYVSLSHATIPGVGITALEGVGQEDESTSLVLSRAGISSAHGGHTTRPQSTQSRLGSGISRASLKTPSLVFSMVPESVDPIKVYPSCHCTSCELQIPVSSAEQTNPRFIESRADPRPCSRVSARSVWVSSRTCACIPPSSESKVRDRLTY